MDFFSDNESRVAYHSNGRAGSWWLRTPNTADTNVIGGICTKGSIGVGGVTGLGGENINGIRLAFCLPRDITVNKSECNTKFLLAKITPMV